ncbi:hypothetical protein L915_18840 [Phytophthora nicotianae]|uniref:Uncharacterized protein n=1 Tax=Phytophthora nicotianae TaxID=4792 RepID=W2FWC1_PHYNI|nr:hypothetical protein L915_18840 [Phytophthora nicotianae]
MRPDDDLDFGASVEVPEWLRPHTEQEKTTALEYLLQHGEALEEAQYLNFKPIFRKVYSETLDRFCLQASIPVSGAAMGEIHEVISSTDGEAHPNWEIGENSWNALKLLPEEKDQSVHRDFPTFETARAL